MDSARVWLETRPVGALLSEIKGLNGTEVAILFEEVLEALVSLEAVGLRHGGLCAERVVVSDKGRPVLIGRGGEEVPDLEAHLDDMAALDANTPVMEHEDTRDSRRLGLWLTFPAQILVLFIITVAACEAGIALALILMLFKRAGTLDMAHWQELREQSEPAYVDHELPADDVAERQWPALTPAGVEPEPDAEEQWHRSKV